ncbi:hypothetical protein AKUG0406_PHAGE200410 (plasmid) [Apilactobacillus kunkeei]|nr:hypothetical protein AKUG0406_PHAGE200410 [Apilactobacillus kunkeei]CAI2678114.1 hypothetical protein AKUG0403_PHAGE200420 [Apilactobacillus kunkeei]CAI2681229.1 hypothetical protein AKUG0420_PHAGE200420 [Apilactobacillus kunkeei]
MATLESYIKIGDGFSDPLNKFYDRLNKAGDALGKLKDKMGGIGNSPKPPIEPYEQFNNTLGRTNSLFKTMTGATLAANGISKVVGGITGELRSMVGELNESSTAWQTFNGNMAMLGMSKNQIAAARKDMQQYAQDTIYSSSDMASTYSQLAAVGVKNAGSLVKGFGGLAAAATDPVQAMKTLSQQGTQMASKPMVQWQDFRLMLEQTPAGIAAVARTMHESAGQLVKDVQGGKLETQKFLDAVAKTGTNKQFTKMATTYKTVGQAMDGLRETAANTLQPAFDKVGKVGIDAISGIIDKIGNIDMTSMADKSAKVLQRIIDDVGSAYDYVAKAGSKFFQGIGDTNLISSLVGYYDNLRGAITNIVDSLFGNSDSKFSGFKNIGKLVGNTLGAIVNDASGLYRAISKMDPNTIKLFAGAIIVLKASMKGIVITGLVLFFQWVNSLNPGLIRNVSTAIAYLAGSIALIAAAIKVWNGIKAIKSFSFGDMFGKSKVPEAPKMPKVPEAPTPPAGGAMEWIKFGTALLITAVAVVIIAGGLWIMAQAAIALADAGWGAIAVFFGMIVAIGVLAAVVAIGGSAMIAGSVGFLIFGLAVLFVGAGIWLIMVGISMLASQLPNIATYGYSAAGAITMLGLAILVFATLAAIAGGLLVIFAAGLIIASVAMVIAGVAAVVLGAGAIVLALGLFLVGAALMVVGIGLQMVATGAWDLYVVLSTIFHNIVSSVKNTMGSIPGLIQGFMKKAESWLKGFNLGDIGHAIINGLVNGMKSAWEAGKRFVSNIGKWIKDHKGPIAYDRTLLIPHGNAIMNGFGEGLNNGFGNVQSDINRMTDNIANTSVKAPDVSDMGLKVNPGDLLANGFDRAKQSLYGLVTGMKDLNTNNNIDVNGNNSSKIPSGSTLGSQIGFTSQHKNDNSRNDNSRNVALHEGAIQINTTGNPDEDIDALLDRLEKALMAKDEGSLA